MLSQGAWFIKIPDESLAELGAAIRTALVQSRSGLDFNPERRAEQHKTRLALRRLARVRGETQYQTGLSTLRVHGYQGRDDLDIAIYDNPDPRENMTQRPGRIHIANNVSDEELGSRVSELLITSQSGER
jgi:hypothetical protein